jgi:transposase-like protein
MPEEKGLGAKILGLFVERDGDETPAEGTDAVSPSGDKRAADLVAEIVGQAATKTKKGDLPATHAAPPPPARQTVPSPTGPVAPARVDFDAVFKSAGMDAAELDRVRKAEELLRSLPEGTPQDVKRQIVEASLEAFGFEIAKIVGAAQNQLKALETYVRLNEQQTAKAISETQAQIARLEEQIIGLRAEITRKTELLASVVAAADVRKGEVTRVLDFFGPPAAPKQ